MNASKSLRTFFGTVPAFISDPSVATLKLRYRWLRMYLGFRTVFEDDGLRLVLRGHGNDWYAISTHESFLDKFFVYSAGGVFLDIGAHVGRRAVRAARAGMNVHAFEPNDEASTALKENLALNGLNATIHDCALGEGSETGTLEFHGAQSSLLPQALRQQRMKATGSRSVQILPLDDFRFDRVDLMKIDTEGYEYPILLGATKTLRKTTRLIVEVHRLDDRPNNERDCLNVIEEAGFAKIEKVTQNNSHFLVATR